MTKTMADEIKISDLAEELLEHVDWLRSNQPAPSIEEIARRMLR